MPAGSCFEEAGGGSCKRACALLLPVHEEHCLVQVDTVHHETLGSIHALTQEVIRHHFMDNERAPTLHAVVAALQAQMDTFDVGKPKSYQACTCRAYTSRHTSRRYSRTPHTCSSCKTLTLPALRFMLLMLRWQALRAYKRTGDYFAGRSVARGFGGPRTPADSVARGFGLTPGSTGQTICMIYCFGGFGNALGADHEETLDAAMRAQNVLARRMCDEEKSEEGEEDTDDVGLSEEEGGHWHCQKGIVVDARDQ